MMFSIFFPTEQLPAPALPEAAVSQKSEDPHIWREKHRIRIEQPPAAETREVMVASAEAVSVPLPVTEEEFRMIAAVVMHEVGHCSRESKIAVTNVILNRLEDGRFGKSIHEILHAPGQFAAISNYYEKELPVDAACIEAVEAALRGEDNSRGAVYYCNPDYVEDPYTRAWFASLEPVLRLDGQVYYRG